MLRRIWESFAGGFSGGDDRLATRCAEEIRRIHVVCEKWTDSDMRHADFLREAVRAQSDFRSFGESLWDADAGRAERFAAAYLLASRHMLAVLDAIEDLKADGYAEAAPVAQKHRRLAFRLPAGFHERRRSVWGLPSIGPTAPADDRREGLFPS